jgi:hypothetical protein
MLLLQATCLQQQHCVLPATWTPILLNTVQIVLIISLETHVVSADGVSATGTEKLPAGQ